MNPLPGSGAENDDGELFLLLEAAAKILAKSGDPSAFLDWIAEAGPHLAPAMARGFDPRTGPPGLGFRAMGVAIYNAMPLPDAGFQPRRIAEPGRNEPCLCGSGEKYKRCCLPLAGTLDLGGYNMLRHVLDTLPKKHFIELPASRVDPIAVYDTARQWQEEGDNERATALLEPWFEGDTPLVGKLEPLFDQLMDCYLALGEERKRDRLVETVLERGDRELRAAALQRRSTMLADRGDIERAWESFREAQRTDPDNPSHAALEITLLVSRGETEQARERARFWIARLERLRDPRLADMIGFLRAVQADPHAAMSDMDRQRVPALGRLEALLAAAPAPEAHCEVADRGEAGRVLGPRQDLARIDERWRKVFPQTKPSLTATQHDFTGMWDEPEKWLDFLAGNPRAWQSFDVLDDLAMAVDVLQTMGTGPSILEPLLGRGMALLDANLDAGAAGNGTLQWIWLENRPALRLLAHLAFRAQEAMDQGASGERFIELAERLIALNPNDNHGIRESLTRAYLARGWPEKALALTDRYPDDFCGPTLNRILALVRIERRGDALTALRDAARHHRTAIDMLLAAAPKQPRPDAGYGITVGSKEEAWEYRAAHRSLWEQDDALDWLGAAWRDVRKTVPRRG
ncbi:MAG: SEC-C domain-containing protein [Betaproteobacteria bacterium]|nr:SEC-C domain-containing protein [Betaproteobacteria bacterium]